MFIKYSPPTPERTAALEELTRIRDLLDRAAARMEEIVTTARREGATWRDIATAARISRSTTHLWFRHVEGPEALTEDLLSVQFGRFGTKAG